MRYFNPILVIFSNERQGGSIPTPGTLLWIRQGKKKIDLIIDK
jgi:hypothetical protein